MQSHRPLRHAAPRLAAAVIALGAIAACSDQPTATEPAAAAFDANRVGEHHDARDVVGGVYTLTNAVAGNAVVAFARTQGGALVPIDTVPTGGTGTGGQVDPLTSQYAVIIDRSHHTLYAVNAGSNDVTVFRVNRDASLSALQRIGSGGTRPVSLAIGDDRLYVLNQGNAAVATFRVSFDGRLAAIPGGVRTFGTGTLVQTAMRVVGHHLVVADGAANLLDVFPLDRFGRPGAPTTTASSGAVPFGFDVTPGGVVVVSEAGAGALSSYAFGARGGFALEDGSVSTGGAAPCWVRITPDGRFAYITNSASDALAGFAVGRDGSLEPLSADGRTGVVPAGSVPLDLDITADGRYLYALDGGSGAISAFSIGRNGQLAALDGVTGAVGPRSGAQGLAAW